MSLVLMAKRPGETSTGQYDASSDDINTAPRAYAAFVLDFHFDDT